MSEEKTLGEIAYETWCYDISHDAWQAVADAVVAAHEARRWRSIETAPRDGTPFLAWHADWAFPDIVWSDGEGWCHDCQPTRWTPITAPPQEVEHEA